MNLFGVSLKFRGDRTIWIIVLILSSISIPAIYSSTGKMAFLYNLNTTHYLLKHTALLLLGLSLMYLVHLVKYTYYSRPAQLFFILSLFALTYTLFFGVEINDAKRWMYIPFTSQTIQTSDFAKVALVMFLARQLSKSQSDIKSARTYLKCIWPPIVTCLLIFPENFSTAAILMVASVCILFIGGIRVSYIFATLGGGLVFLMLLMASFYVIPEESLPGRFATWKSRIETFTGLGNEHLDGSSPLTKAEIKAKQNELRDKDFQAMQAKIAVANGGLLGQLPGNSMQRKYLPHPDSDYIYAILVEEYGLFVALIILGLYLSIFYRAITISKRCDGNFGKLLMLGLSFFLVFQAMINMGVAVDLLPVTGQTLPLLSMGGTSLLFSSISIGIILSVSSSAKEKSLHVKPIEATQNQDL